MTWSDHPVPTAVDSPPPSMVALEMRSTQITYIGTQYSQISHFSFMEFLSSISVSGDIAGFIPRSSHIFCHIVLNKGLVAN
jgi:hypothetical protein